MMNTSTSLIKQMVENQALLNSTAYSETWLAKGQTGEWNYRVAASQEIAEFINSYWTPWWSKENTQDFANCRIELVDAVHFLLSDALILADGDIGIATDSIVDQFGDADVWWVEWHLNPTETTDLVLELACDVQCAINGGDGSSRIFTSLFKLCNAFDFPLDRLHALYLGKSELNRFRQDNGYKLGTYSKKWDGVNEDNYFLTRWVTEQKTTPSSDDIYQFLSNEYAKYTKKV